MSTTPPPASEANPRISFARRRLMGEGAWVLAGRVLSVLAAFVGMRLLTEYLPPAVYGQVSLLLGIAGLANLIVCMPFNQAVFRFSPEMAQSGHLHALRQTIGGILLRRTAGLVLALVLAGAVYAAFTNGSYAVMAILGLLLAAEVAQAFEQNLLSAARRQRAVAIWLVVVDWLRPLMAVAAVMVLGQSASAVMLGNLVALAGALVFLYAISFPFEGLEPSVASGDSSSKAPSLPADIHQQIMSYASPLIFLGVVAWVHSLGDRYILERMIGLEQVGLYVAAYGLTQKPFAMAEGVFQQTLLPAYNQAVSAGNRDLEKRLFRTWLGLVTGIVVVGCVCVYTLKGWAVRILLAEEYRSSVSLMPWLGVGFACLAIAHVFEFRLYSLKRTRFVLLGQTIGAIASLIVLIPMISKWGLMGAALACPIYYTVYMVAMIVLSQVAIHTHYRDLEELG